MEIQKKLVTEAEKEQQIINASKQLIEKIKKIFKKSKEEDSIHLRAIRYGAKYPNGFMYKDIEYYYSKRKTEWAIVNEHLTEAWNNKNGAASRITPFVLLEKAGNGNADKCKYTLSYDAYFAYLQYLNAKKAKLLSIIAIVIAMLSIIFEINKGYVSARISISPCSSAEKFYVK